MPIVRRRLRESDVYPDDIRYNENGDKVERFIDGEWKESPESDPRKQTTLPPRITTDTKCDAGRSVADALQNQITEIATAIDNAQTVATIAGLILGLFSFGVFAIFINIALAIAGYMLDAGTAAINSSLPSTAYDALTCILSCYFDNNGRLKTGSLPAIYQDIADNIALPGAQVLISMLELAGEGGVNNLAAAGTSTGDCSSCDDCGCFQGCTTVTTTYLYNNAAWTAHGTYTRSLASTPVGSFDSFEMKTVEAALTLPALKCITLIAVSTNTGCAANTLARLEVLINGVAQGDKMPLDRAGCGTSPGVSWAFDDGIEGTVISFRQTSLPCQPTGRDNRLFCCKVTTCV